MGCNCVYGVHNANVNNALRAVMERVMFVKRNGGFEEPPAPRPGTYRLTLRKFRKRLLRLVSKTPRYSNDQFVGCYTGRKKAIYARAAESLLVREIERKDAYLDSFLKAEKVDFTTKDDPPPRLIQTRPARFHISLGTYTKPIEHNLYRGIDKLFGAPTVAKSKNSFQRGRILREAWNTFTDPIAVTLDASRFDQHVSVEALQWEHSVYNALFDNCPELQKLLSWQVDNLGFIRVEDGTIKYKIKGRRCSGDMNTALGNVLLMCAMMWAYLARFPGSRLVNDGDDCVVMLERHQFAELQATYLEFFESLGFTMKLEGYTTIFEEIDFCACRPIFDGSTWRMVRDPRKSLDKDLISVRPVTSHTTWANYCSAIADCGLALAGDLPVLGAFYGMLHQGRDVDRQLLTGMDYMARGLEQRSATINDTTRFSFYKAFGIKPDEQTALEEFYRSVTLSYETPNDNNINKPHFHEPHTLLYK